MLMTTDTMPRRALVTGAGQRIGQTIATALGRAGWDVAVHHNRSADGAAATAEAVRATGRRAELLRADLSREDETAGLIERAEAALGGTIGCLINNAAIFEMDTVASATRRTWDAHMEINLRAPFVLIQALTRRLPEDAQACIVNMIDARVWNFTANFVSYTVAKSGLWTLTQTMAMALAPRIRVNAVGPGPTLQDKHRTREEFEALRASMPLGRGTTPEEVANAVLYLIDSPAVTGQMIALDGGQHLGWVRPGGARNPAG